MTTLLHDATAGVDVGEAPHDGPAIRFRGTRIPVILPNIRDARLHVAFVLLSVQLLGQVVLDFELSIAQLLVSIGTCAGIGVAWSLRTHRALIWPASAMLTGNGIALILRVSGTRHGDWWSLRGWHIFVATGVLAMASKAVFRRRDRHIFNPSNVALVVTFLILGSAIVEPLDFWWGPMSWGLVLAVVLIVGGGSLILRRAHLLSMALGFWAVFSALLLVLGAFGHCMTARWSLQPVCGTRFAGVISGSPETLIFTMFMLTDPKTVPVTPRARRWFGPMVAVLAAAILTIQRTEFAHKVGVLIALVVMCALTPLLERWLDGAEAVDAAFASATSPFLPTGPRVRPARPAVAAAVLVVAVMGWNAAIAPALPSRYVPAGDIRVASDRFGRSVEDLPEIAIDASDRVATRIPRTDARQMVGDAIAGLISQADAVRTADRRLAARSADGVWLDGLERDIRDVRAGREVSIPVYQVDRAIVSVGRRPGQAAPALLVTLRGTVAQLDAATGRTGDQRERAVVTFEVQYRDSGRYVIVTDQPPKGFVAPR